MKQDNSFKGKCPLTLSSILSIHLVFIEICKYLPFQDLLVLSNVSTEHRKCTRLYMRKHRICCAHSSNTSPPYINPCRELKRFEEFLSQSNSSALELFPCNGFRDLFRNHVGPVCSPRQGEQLHNIGEATVEETFPNIFLKLELKYFMLAWPFNLCPLYIRVLKELFLRNAHQLERLDISVNDEVGTFSTLRLCTSKLDDQKEFLKMPNLRTLHFVRPSSQSRDIELFLLDFLEAAPNLQIISGEMTNRILTLPEASLREWSRTIFRNIHFNFKYLTLPNVQVISRTGLQLSDLDVTYFPGLGEVMYKDEICLVNWEPLMLSILINSQRTLRKLFCTMSQLLYFSEQIQSFPNLQNLRLWSGTDKGTYARMLEYLGVIDLQLLFPKLTEFNLYPHQMPGLENKPLDAIIQRQPLCISNTFLVPSVSKVWIYNNNWIYEHSALADISEIAFGKIVETFPNVKDLFVSRGLLERYFRSVPGGKLKCRLESLGLRNYTVSEEAMQNLFSGLQRGLQTLDMEPMPRILHECGVLFRQAEDGHVIPFMSNETARQVQEAHPGLEITIRCSYHEFQKPGISLTSFCPMKPFAAASKRTYDGSSVSDIALTFSSGTYGANSK